MTSLVQSAETLANGLREEFFDTYSSVKNRLMDSRVADVMDLSIAATNRQHEFAYYESAPMMDYWERGTTVPTNSMGSVGFTVPVYEWGRKIPWSKWDRKDDQTHSLMDIARQAAESSALIPQRMLTDLIENTTSFLPSVPMAPDGVALYSALDGVGGSRFGVSGGNIETGGGTGAVQILADYYQTINRFRGMLDTQGQPLLGDHITEAGVIIMHPLAMTEAMEQAFLQKRQIDSGGSSPSNVVQDASRNVELWGNPRLTVANDWYVFLKAPPKKPLFLLERQAVEEYSALEGDNNSDGNRDRAEEYLQFESRSGGGVGLPFATIKVNN